MAATDKPFNNQRTLDIVFAVSSILMLFSVVAMLYADHYREYKDEQRAFREAEYALAQRTALDQIPSEADFAKAEEEVKKALAKRQEKKDDLASVRASLLGLQPQREKAEAKFQAAKSDVESITSFLSIALEHRDDKLSERYRNQLKELNEKQDKAANERDEIVSKMKAEQAKIDAIEGEVTKAVAQFKKINDKLDAQVKLALSKRWGWGDWFRTQPVINAFADPIKIHQFTLNDIPIDYNFKMVTRYDRCMTCHLGIDRPAYTKENLEALTKDVDSTKLDEARKLYDRRIAALKDDPSATKTIPNPHDLRLTRVPESVLTPSRVKEFAAHPRLDLFVGSNSKHPTERFGCSSCHYGQGSGTSFIDSSHAPNTNKERTAWHKDRHWAPNHMWDFPMLPTRFIEASCIKCHHEVTDLVGADGRVEAPKVLKGYNLIKENGCFGCHEISGYKSGVRVGPDMRLEPSVPLDQMHPIERDRAVKDTDNRPGDMRKVGPALSRISEKTNLNFIAKWVRSPSSFRPDTKMPHYYGLSNNTEDAIKATAPDHEKSPEKFPNTEIASIAHFLMQTSKSYLNDAEEVRKKGTLAEDEAVLLDLLTRQKLDSKDQEKLAEVKLRIKLRKEVKLVDLTPGYNGDANNGRVLFSERGCLACHTHQGTDQPLDVKGMVIAGVSSTADFGPNLSQLAGKFEPNDKEKARIWLTQWIMNPQVHSPRSRMPVTHLEPKQAADIAEWLLSQKATDVGEDWETLKVDPPSKDDLQNLARVYLTRMLSKSDMERFVKGELSDTEFKLIKSDLTKDEQDLYPRVKDENALKFYLGKKAVSRLGCYACHDIPGFESTKPIGVGLNDWGKKPADRLAFEDIANFFKKHYYSEGVDSLEDKDAKPYPVKDGKEPYEEYYAEALLGHFKQREGYLNQKVRDPRSYDFNRIRAWDDRARMPKFNFARPKKKAGEDKDALAARIIRDNAVSREAVAAFVLGLVAEQVPVKSINQPTGDRLAEVKGRQILDKYNCASCHLIRPGVYDFKLGPLTREEFERTHSGEAGDIKTKGEQVYLNHRNWVGRNPTSLERLTLFGNRPSLTPGKPPMIELRLSEALRFVGKDRSVKDIPGGAAVLLAGEDLTSDPAALKSQADFERRFQTSAPYGGAFTDLMVGYLNRKDPKGYPLDGGAAAARASLPPSLIGQGERTQTKWLTQFLLDPQPIRKMAILRMPKFNMSKDEADILVDYFTAVTRQNNPGIGLYPNEVIAAREDLSSDYWKKKTADYVAYLKRTNEKTKEGKPLEKTLYQMRVAEFTPLWEDIKKTREPDARAALEKIEKAIAAKNAEIVAMEKGAAGENDAKKAQLADMVKALKAELASAQEARATAEKALQALEVKAQQKHWEEREAYAVDGYRLVLSKDLCTKCHQVGAVAAGEPNAQGPPLALSADRLRPEWLVRWINKPQRFVPYPSLMPPYFNQTKLEYQHLHAGPANEQIDALRDVLMNFPRVSELPLNRLQAAGRK